MTRYYLAVETLSPLSITRHQNIAGLANSSLPYIPGSTLRGALAWQLLQENPAVAKDPAFQQLFDHEGLRCGPLYPLPAESASDIALPIPLTARSCKQHEGFARTPTPLGRGHGVWDTLVHAVTEKAIQEARALGQTPPTEWQGLAACEQCGHANCTAPLQRTGGYFVWERGEQSSRLRKSAVALRLLARTALLAELESARPAALFSREAIDAGQRFAGFIDVEPTMPPLLARILAAGAHLYVGAGRTAGLGKLVIKRIDPERDPLRRLLGSLAPRLQAFQQRLAPSLQSAWAFAPITLLSDMILLDPYLRFAAEPTPTIIQNYLALAAQVAPQQPPPPMPADLQLFLTVNGTKRIAGWNTAAKPARPRHDDYAVVAGSVFVLAAPPTQAQALTRLCLWLEENGLGERRAEGFGALAVAFPMHSTVGVL